MHVSQKPAWINIWFPSLYYFLSLCGKQIALQLLFFSSKSFFLYCVSRRTGKTFFACVPLVVITSTFDKYRPYIIRHTRKLLCLLHVCVSMAVIRVTWHFSDIGFLFIISTLQVSGIVYNNVKFFCKFLKQY